MLSAKPGHFSNVLTYTLSDGEDHYAVLETSPQADEETIYPLGSIQIKRPYALFHQFLN
jgi:hypothetical protein